MGNRFDFSGYATKNDLKCADGRTIRRNAFQDCDGATVPLVWQHQHNDPNNVLGHAILENRDDGVYAYGVFNDSAAGKTAKELVRHGDIKALSIYANQLVQKGRDVLHGMIREVSLVLAGANPGAMIEDLSFEHFADDDTEFEAIITNGDNLELMHSDDSDDEEEYDEDDYDDSEEEAHEDDEDDGDDDYEEDEEMAHSEERTIAEIINGLTDEEREAVEYLVGAAREDAASDDYDDDEYEEYEEEEEMAHNVFEQDTPMNTITHDDMKAVLADAPDFGTLSKAVAYHEQNGVLAHAIDTAGMEVSANRQQYFVNDPSFLFPEAKALSNIPEWIKRDMDWVTEVLNNTHHTPFSRIKSVFANITEADARAKGYLKGNQKTEEVFTLLKRTTDPQTIYKKQKVDRDDMLDITDFNTVAWIKDEMRMMLNEEIAQAVLIGDGRSISSPDKIQEAHVRPIVSDAPLFTIQATVTPGATEEATAKNFIKAAVRARKNYKGSGNPVLFTTEDVLTSMLLIEDGIGHMLYKSEAEVATALRVSKIVTVPVMENRTLANGNTLLGVIVNLRDYNIGADKGGEINMFDDFDIDYNQQKYLIETRISGALIKPYSAIALSMATESTNP